MLKLERIILEAIFGACCNTPRSPSYIKGFVLDGLLKGGYVEDSDVPHLKDSIDETILHLRRDNSLSTEYYLQGEFHVLATDKFAQALGYGRQLC